MRLDGKFHSQEEVQMPQSLTSFLAEIMELEQEAKEVQKTKPDSETICTVCEIQPKAFSLSRNSEVIHFCPGCYLDYIPDYHREAILEIFEIEARRAIIRGREEPLMKSPFLRGRADHKSYGGGRIVDYYEGYPDIGDFQACACCEVECYCFTIANTDKTYIYLCPSCYLSTLPEEERVQIETAVRKIFRMAMLRESFAP